MLTKNQEYITRRLSATFAELAEFPKYFLIETLKGCNAKCIMCPLMESNRKAGVMDKALFQKIVDEMAKYTSKIRHVGLYLLGEPLLDKDIFNKIQKLNDIGIKDVLVASNGSLLNEENIRKLLEVKLGKIYVSVDGFSKESYENIRIGLSFDTLVKNVKNLFRLRDELGANLVIRLQLILQEKNMKEMDKWKAYWGKFTKDQDELKVIKVVNWGMQVDVHDFDVEELVTPCISPFGTMIILYDGTVPLCCADFDSKVTLGNLNETSMADIWKSDKLKKIQESFLDKTIDIPLCKKCNVWREDKYFEE